MSARSKLFCLTLALGAWLTPALASAEDAATGEPSGVALSEQRAAEAFQAYSKKDYAAAVALYLQAYEAAPNGSILYNIARIYDTKLGDRPLAITYYRRYIADPGAYVERIEFANQRLKQLREAETLTQKLSDANGAAKADEATAPSQQHPPAAAKPQTRTPDATETPGWSTMRWTGVVLGAAGLAALGTGAVFGLSAMSKADTAKQLCDGNACSTQRGVDAANSANDAAMAANIGFFAGAGLLATGVTLFVLGSRPTTEATPTAVRWSPRATSSDLGLEVSGRW